MKNRNVFISICISDALLLAGCIYMYINQDRIGPVISFDDEEITYTEKMESEALLEGVYAYDMQDGDVSYSLLVEKISQTPNGEVIVTYAAKDASNNVTKNVRIIPAEGLEKETELQHETTESPSTAGTETERIEEMLSRADYEAEEAEINQEEAVEREERTPDEGGQISENPDEENQGEEPENEQVAVDEAVGQDRQNAAPILVLNSNSISVGVGSTFVDWSSCIQQLSDDQDSKEQLLTNLIMEGHVDLNTPGSYPVILYTRDSEGMPSEHQSITVVVV